MLFDLILVAIDDQPHSKAALDYAIKLARRERAELMIIAVAPIPQITGTIDEVIDAGESGREHLEPFVRAAREEAERQGQPVKTSILLGHPAEVICDYARANNVDLIVLGKKRHHFGSVSERVIKQAPCPVFIAGESEVIKYIEKGAESGKWELRKDMRTKLEGKAKMMRIYIGEGDRLDDKPLYQAIVLKLRELDMAGATVYRGIMGYGGHQRLHKSRFLGLSRDLPIMISAVDTQEKINSVLPLIEEMVSEGLIVLSEVTVIKYAHGRAPD